MPCQRRFDDIADIKLLYTRWRGNTKVAVKTQDDFFGNRYQWQQGHLFETQLA